MEHLNDRNPFRSPDHYFYTLAQQEEAVQCREVFCAYKCVLPVYHVRNDRRQVSVSRINLGQEPGIHL